MNENWSKWIQRALLKYFTTNLPGLNLISETADVNKNQLTQWCELRVDIKYKCLHTIQWHAYVNVNILVVCAKKPNLYNMKSITGKIASVFADLPVINDNAGTAFCLRVDSDYEISDTYYGELENQANMEQATVEGVFEAFILE